MKSFDSFAPLVQKLSIPGRSRSLILRRLLAGLLVLGALVSALNAQRAAPEVVVFARDVHAGSIVTEQDVAMKAVPVEMLPGGDGQSSLSIDDVVGRISASMATAGEVVTENRLVGEDLTNRLVANSTYGNNSEPAHMVSVKVANPEIIPLLHHGDTVDILTAFDTDTTEILEDTISDPSTDHDATTPEFADRPPLDHLHMGGHLIAAGGHVIATGSETSGAGHGKAGTVLIALPASLAARVATASLKLPLAIVITGDRAHAEPRQ